MKKLVYRALGLAVALSVPAIGIAVYRGDDVGPMLGAIGIAAGVLLFTFLLGRMVSAAIAAAGWPRLGAALNRPWREALGGKESVSRAD